MKLLFDIKEYSQFTKKWVTMRTKCSYELDTNNLQELYNETLRWAAPHMNSRQRVFNLRLEESNVPDADSYIDEDRFTDFVLEQVSSDCEPEYQGEEGLMRATEEYIENYQEISWRNKILLVEL